MLSLFSFYLSPPHLPSLGISPLHTWMNRNRSLLWTYHTKCMRNRGFGRGRRIRSRVRCWLIQVFFLNRLLAGPHRAGLRVTQHYACLRRGFVDFPIYQSERETAIRFTLFRSFLAPLSNASLEGILHILLPIPSQKGSWGGKKTPCWMFLAQFGYSLPGLQRTFSKEGCS
jgi:hypothetical protein